MFIAANPWTWVHDYSIGGKKKVRMTADSVITRIEFEYVKEREVEDMAWNPEPKVGLVRDLANDEEFNCQMMMVVYVDIPNSQMGVVTYGKNRKLCKLAGKLGERAYQAVEGWFEEEEGFANVGLTKDFEELQQIPKRAPTPAPLIKKGV